MFQDIRDDMYTHNPEYEQLRELGRQIMNSDPTKAGAIQQQLGQVRKLKTNKIESQVESSARSGS